MFCAHQRFHANMLSPLPAPPLNVEEARSLLSKLPALAMKVKAEEAEALVEQLANAQILFEERTAGANFFLSHRESKEARKFSEAVVKKRLGTCCAYSMTEEVMHREEVMNKDEAFLDKVKNCDVFLAFVSESYLQNPFSQWELKNAQMFRKPVFCFVKMTDKPKIGAFKHDAPPEYHWLFDIEFVNIDVTDVETFRHCVPLFIKKALLKAPAPEFIKSGSAADQNRKELAKLEKSRQEAKKGEEEAKEREEEHRQDLAWRKEAKPRLARIKQQYDYCGKPWKEWMEEVCNMCYDEYRYNVHILNQSDQGNGHNGGKVESETPELVDITIKGGWLNQFTYTYVVRVAPIGKKWQVLNDGNSKGKTWKSSDDQCWKGNPKNPGDFSGWVEFS